MRDFLKKYKPEGWEVAAFIFCLLLTFAVYAAVRYFFPGNEEAAKTAQLLSNFVWFGFFYSYGKIRNVPEPYDDGE